MIHPLSVSSPTSPKNVLPKLAKLIASLVTLLTISGCATSRPPHDHQASLKRSLTFHASFDRGLDADFARGDARIYHAASTKKPRVPQPGLPSNGVVSVANGSGRFGNALRFNKKATEVLLFKAADNINYKPKNWEGTVSLWLKVDPASELAPGFCDPIQITPRDWNDAAFFVEFEKKPDIIPFRLGAYPDLKVWNPNNRKWEEIPAEEKPLNGILKPPFRSDRWTHVVFTFQRFNTGEPNGIARLYLDGELSAVISPRTQTFTWNPEEAIMMMGVAYVGLYDELSIFNKALSESEIRSLNSLPNGVHDLH